MSPSSSCSIQGPAWSFPKAGVGRHPMRQTPSGRQGDIIVEERKTPRRNDAPALIFRLPRAEDKASLPLQYDCRAGGAGPLVELYVQPSSNRTAAAAGLGFCRPVPPEGHAPPARQLSMQGRRVLCPLRALGRGKINADGVIPQEGFFYSSTTMSPWRNSGTGWCLSHRDRPSSGFGKTPCRTLNSITR